MKELLQGKVTEIEFAFGILTACGIAVAKSVNSNQPVADWIKQGFMSIFVAIITGLIFIEYFNSSSIIIASMGLAGYSGAGFLDSISIISKTIDAIKTVLGQSTDNKKK